MLFYLPAEPVQYHPILLWGLSVVRAVQSVAIPGFGSIMSFITVFAVIVVIPLPSITVWCFDEKKGVRLGILLALSGWINSFLKALLKQPRPFDLDPSVGLAYESSYGLPSGHSQISIVLAFFFAVLLSRIKPGKKVLIWSAAVVYVLLVGLSRVYLGVHFPTDLAGGWLVGGIILLVFFCFEKQIVSLLLSAGKRGQLIVAAAAALLMVVLLPEDSSMAAMFLGTACGYALMINSVPFAARGDINGKKPGLPVYLLRFLIGSAGAGLVFIVLNTIFPGGQLFKDTSWWGPSSPFMEIGRFIRYGCLGLWISFLAPSVFGRLNLANNRPAVIR